MDRLFRSPSRLLFVFIRQGDKEREWRAGGQVETRGWRPLKIEFSRESPKTRTKGEGGKSIGGLFLLPEDHPRDRTGPPSGPAPSLAFLLHIFIGFYSPAYKHQHSFVMEPS